MKILFNLIFSLLFLLLSVGINVTSFNICELARAVNVSSIINSSLSNNTKTSGTKVVDNKSKNDNEVIHSKNAIKKILDEDGAISVTAELLDDKQEVKITIYNMLGKEIRKVYQGLPKNKDDEGYYVFTAQAATNLPKNIYFLVIQGATFKIASKFIIAK